MCTEGYGTGADNACYSCTDVKARWLIFAGSIFALVALLFVFVAVTFLVGGLDAVDEVRRSVWKTKGRSVVGLAPPVRESSFPMRKSSVSTMSSGRDLRTDDPVAPAFARGNGRSIAPVDQSDADVSSRRGYTRSQDTNAASLEAEGDAEPGCCGCRARLKRWASKVPLNKLKILVVIWQILTVFPSIASVDFPPLYSRFLSWIDFVNFDIGAILSASCMLPGVSFYDRLLLTTLAPLALALVLVATFQMAKRRARTGSTDVVARRMAWSRHMAAGLLLTFLVRFSFLLREFGGIAIRRKPVVGHFAFFLADEICHLSGTTLGAFKSQLRYLCGTFARSKRVLPPCFSLPDSGVHVDIYDSFQDLRLRRGSRGRRELSPGRLQLILRLE